MSSFDELVAALGARKQEIYQTNPWLGAGSAVLKQDYYDPRSSNASNLGAALLSGLGGGMMRGYGKQQAEQEYLDEASALGSVLDMQGPQRMEAIDANPVLQPYKPLILLGQKRDEEEQAQMAAKIQQQKDMMDYQQQAKAKYAIAKPMVAKQSALARDAEYITQTLGPDAAKTYLLNKAGVPQAAATTATPTPAPESESLDDLVRSARFPDASSRNKAIEQLNETKILASALTEIRSKWGELKNVKSMDALIPYSPAAAKFNAALLDVMPQFRPIFGALAEKEREYAQSLVPDRMDSKETIDTKIQLMEEFLRSKAATASLDVALGADRVKKLKDKLFAEAPLAPGDGLDKADSGGLPQVGGMFNGQKVKSIVRVK